jgi:glycosyltransferase involved in cell wall biosynthesis
VSENPKVSVIIPTYNRAATVQKAIESVLAQTVTDLEVIVVDDGSLDDTGTILGRIYANRIRYFAQVNQGVSAARNKGIAKARGEWVAFLDSDDLWVREKLEWQLKALKRFAPDCGACYTDVQLFNHSETRTMFQMAQGSYVHEGEMGVNPQVLKVLVIPGGAGMVVCPSSLLARTDLVRRTGGLNPKLRFQQDTEFMFRLAMLANFCYVNRPLVLFDRSPDEIRHVGVSADWNKVEFVLQDSQIWLEGLLELREGIPTDVRNLIRKQLGSVHSGLANWHLGSGRYQWARESMTRAAQLDLTFNIALKWLLTWMSPRLALRAVRHHQDRRKDSAPFI